MKYAILLIFLLLLQACTQTMANQIVVLETNRGVIEIELYEEQSPKTVANFLSYVNDGFYDGLIFHRVIPNFMIQGGGFTQQGQQKQTKAAIPLESNNGLKNTVSTVAMARTNDPNSATSQFFINVADNAFLDYAQNNLGYAVFGRVISGMDVVNEIAAVQTASRGPFADWPVEDVIIERAYLKE